MGGKGDSSHTSSTEQALWYWPASVVHLEVAEGSRALTILKGAQPDASALVMVVEGWLHCLQHPCSMKMDELRPYLVSAGVLRPNAHVRFETES